jgi:hypothetical protein
MGYDIQLVDEFENIMKGLLKWNSIKLMLKN